MRAFIRANLRAYLPGLESIEAVNSTENEPDVAYSRPVNPTMSQGYDEAEAELER